MRSRWSLGCEGRGRSVRGHPDSSSAAPLLLQSTARASSPQPLRALGLWHLTFLGRWRMPAPSGAALDAATPRKFTHSRSLSSVEFLVAPCPSPTPGPFLAPPRPVLLPSRLVSRPRGSDHPSQLHRQPGPPATLPRAARKAGKEAAGVDSSALDSWEPGSRPNKMTLRREKRHTLHTEPRNPSQGQGGRAGLQEGRRKRLGAG